MIFLSKKKRFTRILNKKKMEEEEFYQGPSSIKNYAEFLKSLRPTPFLKITKPHYQNGVLVSAGRAENVLLPPNNCLFDISKAKPLPLNERLQSASTMFARATKGEEVIPRKLNWVDINPNITPVVNQYLCGCCWAVSIATAIADKFVVANLINFNPKVSWSYLITCWVNEINMKCGGSNPFLALQYVENSGIGTEDLPGASFHWCTDSKACNPPKTAENTPKSKGEEEIKVPECKAKNKKGVRFFIRNVKSVPLDEETANDDVKLKASILSVKKHIQKYGPTVGGYSVYPNFRSGDFRCGDKNLDNIYLENVDYEKEKYKLLKDETIGTHAVVLVGWGVGKVAESLLKADGDKNSMVSVDYWIVRNSWGDKWGGLKGLFHIAMYPINKKSQFDVSVYFTSAVEDPNTGVYSYKKIITSGILLFEPAYFGEDKPPKSTLTAATTPSPSPGVGSIESYTLVDTSVNRTGLMDPESERKIQREQRERAIQDQRYVGADFFLFYIILLTLILFLMILLATSLLIGSRNQGRH